MIYQLAAVVEQDSPPRFSGLKQIFISHNPVGLLESSDLNQLLRARRSRMAFITCLAVDGLVWSGTSAGIAGLCLLQQASSGSSPGGLRASKSSTCFETSACVAFATVPLAIASHMAMPGVKVKGNHQRARTEGGAPCGHSYHPLPAAIVSGDDHHCPDKETKAQRGRVTPRSPGWRQSKGFPTAWNLSPRSTG